MWEHLYVKMTAYVKRQVVVVSWDMLVAVADKWIYNNNDTLTWCQI